MELRKEEQRIENLQEHINAIIDNLPIGIVLKDEGDDFEHLYSNKFMENITGTDSSINIESKNGDKLNLDVLISTEKKLELNKKRIQPSEIIKIQSKIKTTSGESKHMEITQYPISLKNGKQILLELWSDITSQVEMENELKKIQKLAKMALGSGDIRITSIEINPDSKKQYFDSKVELFSRGEHTCNENMKFFWPVVIKWIHPDDLAMFNNYYFQLCSGIISESKFEIRNRLSDTEQYRWREISSYVQERDEIGRPVVILSCSSDIQERKEQEQYLSEAKLKAEKADKLKSKYLANMSHEIRTPLNAITGFSELMAYAESDEERKEYYEIIKTNNLLLMQLINDILDMSKIEADVMKITYSQIDLNELIHNIYSSASLRMPEGVQLILEEDIVYSHFITDSIRLMQLINNLVNNAIKNTIKGSITIRFNKEENMMKFQVQDTGIGIAKEKLSGIFDRYVKINDYVDGIGLGLAICHGLVTTMGGKIWVESELGTGSTFSFSLPIKTEL